MRTVMCLHGYVGGGKQLEARTLLAAQTFLLLAQTGEVDLHYYSADHKDGVWSGEWVRHTLEMKGVPSGAIHGKSCAKDTIQEVEATLIFGPHADCYVPVTTAYHVPRASALFRWHLGRANRTAIVEGVCTFRGTRPIDWIWEPLSWAKLMMVTVPRAVVFGRS